MKPNFALDISETSVRLLHRTPSGWLAIGEAAYDSPDLDEAVGFLRTSALGLSPHGITTKLILPESQVLYCEVEAKGQTRAEMRAEIAAGLEGRTPYAVEDLAFDWSGKGPVVQVAVVAKETLAEAEAFATAHRLNPVSLVTSPSLGRFGGEPWFGPTTLAATLLPAGEQVTRDQEPVPAMGRPAPEREEQAPQADGADEEADRIAAEAARMRAEAEAARDARDRARAEERARGEADAAGEEARRRAQADRARAEADARAEAEAARVAGEAARKRAALAGAEHRGDPPGGSKRSEADVDAAMEPAQDGEAALPVDPDGGVPPSAPAQGAARPPVSASVEIADGTPDAPPAFASRRREDPARTAAEAASAIAAAPKIDAGSGGPPSVALSGGREARADQRLSTPVDRKTGASDMGQKARDARRPGIDVTGPDRVGAMGGSARVPPAGTGRTVDAPAVKGPVVPGPMVAAPVVASPMPSGRAAVALSPAAKPGPSDARPVAARPKLRPFARSGEDQVQGRKTEAPMGSFGAKLAKPRGRPRYLGLVLTVALLIVLALVAAWSSFYLTRDESVATTDVASGVATDTVGTGDAPVPQDAGLAEDPAIDPRADGAEVGAGPVAGEATSDTVPDLAGDAVPAPGAAGDDTAIAQPPLPTDPTEGGAQPDLARTERTDDGKDEIFLATTDATRPADAAAALPRPPVATDPSPVADVAPPPFGTTYAFDAEGRIVPGKTAITTPEGVRLIEARPMPEPPPRPSTPEVAAVPDVVAPVRPAASNAAAAGLAGAAPPAVENEFAEDPAVSRRRPETRPADAASPGPRTADDAPQPSGTEVSGLRPRSRPQALLAAAEKPTGAAAASLAGEASAAASLAANAAAASAVDRVASASAIASIPRRPAARPDDFSGAVQAAVASATRRAPLPGVAAPPEAAAAPSPELAEADSEPDAVAPSRAPRIPTRANVAKQATFVNAINLSQTNLIGVYGSSSNRYALVRSSTGRFSKVKVGDRIDGGRVASISGSDLRYQKGSRIYVLAMPKG